VADLTGTSAADLMVRRSTACPIDFLAPVGKLIARGPGYRVVGAEDAHAGGEEIGEGCCGCVWVTQVPTAAHAGITLNGLD
jgi:hypothetical protein